MLKQKESTLISSSEVTGCRTVVTETVETRTMPDGRVVTTTKKTTSVAGDDFESKFKDLELIDSTRQSSQMVVKKTMLSSDNGNVKKVEPKKPSKSFSERLGLKSKSKTKDLKGTDVSSKVENIMDVEKFEKDSLKSHNTYRAKHGVPPLKLSKQLCAYSKEWADHLVATDTFQHRTERKYGENIYTKWSSDPNHVISGNDAVDSWYSEIKDYTFGKEPTTLKSGHFTQVIWKESKELGIALSRSSNGKVFVVANYDPAGNFVGKFTENVPPPKK